ncbi:hypothetical protein GMLC_13980 [Geomonas limicola]|uniref:Uncharacterized protein n=1 Tax=Geomonas limicola TaxID=2740186 RepID=A0A6V8N978_9BACT|nr:hypothetical protein GMLC_13980 [Geomonas limicola]
MNDDAGLAGTGTGQDQQGAVAVQHRFFLGWIEVVEQIHGILRKALGSGNAAPFYTTSTTPGQKEAGRSGATGPAALGARILAGNLARFAAPPGVASAPVNGDNDSYGKYFSIPMFILV